VLCEHRFALATIDRDGDGDPDRLGNGQEHYRGDQVIRMGLERDRRASISGMSSSVRSESVRMTCRVWPASVIVNW
jgi:hypothetical protein